MILLVNPPVNRLCGFEMNYYPLGLGYLAAQLKGLGHEVRIYNAETSAGQATAVSNRDRIGNHRLFVEALENREHEVWKEFRQVLDQVKPTLVGFSCTSASILPCLIMAQQAKELCGATTIFGGMHPTLLPQETAASEWVDYVLTGEAEDSLCELVTALGQGSELDGIPGLGRFVGDEFRYREPLPLPADLDRFAFPDRDVVLLPERNNRHLNSIVSSRGCPYPCTYCAGRAIHCGQVRYRNLESIVAEMRLLRDRYGFDHVRFYDDAFVLKRERIVALCRLLIKADLGMTWGAFTRADSVDRELLALMSRSGCVFLGVGVESGSDRVLKAIRKGYSREQALAAIRWIKDAGIDVGISIMVGLPMETDDDIRQTISLIDELQVPTNVNTFTPYPGSQLHEECVRRGLLEDGIDWAWASQHSPNKSYIAEIPLDRYLVLFDEMLTVADRIKPFTPTLYRRLERLWNLKGRRPGPFLAELGVVALARLKGTR
jgi:anaerobic magnesium-protoporphyrin IX monomethyl ester cyclase